jgi:flagellar P-ring protein precursor FlgI
MGSGPVSIGGFSFSGDAASVQKNHPTTGRIPNGGVVEECVPTDFGRRDTIRLLLGSADFETASRVREAINQAIPSSAHAQDAGTVEIRVPNEFRDDLPGFIGMLGNLRINPDVNARVVINERTGTIVVGEYVRLSRVAITHANLSVITGETPEVSQPLPFSRGRTEVVPRTQLDVVEESKPVHVVDEPVTVGDLAQALNALGVTPRDLSAIFQQLKSSGALHAELIFE